MSEDTPNAHDDWVDEEGPLPVSVRVFTSPELDNDEATARGAAEEISHVTRRLLDSLIELEDMERALRESEPVSTRAHDARVGVRQAIDGLDDVIGGVSEARDAFTFYWASRRRRGAEPSDLGA